MPGKRETVKVAVRLRPLLEKQYRQQLQLAITPDLKQLNISSHSQDTLRIFNYDHVFPKETSQQQVYQLAIFQLVDTVLEGYNATVLAYGMTGSGKTYTMIGKKGEQEGISPRSFSQLMSGIQSNGKRVYLAQCSFIEIYNEQVRDLLTDRQAGKRMKLDIHETAERGVFVKGAKMVLVRSVEDMRKVLDKGMHERATSQTSMNKESSRSHAIFTVHLQSSECDDSQKKNFRASKLHMVDLAGSERVGRMNTVGERFLEGAKINLSLGALGNVINALIDKKSKHIPYRDSKLTRLLQDSLGGHSHTLMIATVSPAACYYDETICTLRFSSRAQLITNMPTINEDYKDALLREYQEEIRRLKKQLQAKHDTTVMNQVIRLEQDILRPGQQITGTFSKEEYQALKLKAEEQRKERIRIEQEKRIKEEQLVFMENNYQTLEEEVSQMRDLLKQLRLKYRVAAQEVIDLENDHHLEKEYLIETVRNLSKEIQIYQNVISKLVTPEQMEEILALTEDKAFKQKPNKQEFDRRQPERDRDEFATTIGSGGFKIRRFRSTQKLKMNKTGIGYRPRRQ